MDSEDVATQLLNLVVDLGCVAGIDGTFRELTDGWGPTLGYAHDELLHHPFLELVHEEDRPATTAVLETLRGGAGIRQFRNRFVAKDGSPRWLKWSATMMPGRDEYYAVAQDETEKHLRDAAIAESRKLYADLIESSHDLVQSIRPDGHFEFVNRAWHELLGYSPEELPGLTLFDVVDVGDHDHCNLLIAQLMHGKSFKQIEITFVTKDGRRVPAEGNATGRRLNGEYVATHAFFHDVSERKEAERLSANYQRELEREVAERTSALVRSEKLATLGRLSAGMAHELNNPAAAAQRGAARLRETLSQMQSELLGLGAARMSSEATAALADLLARAERRAATPDILDALDRSDLESAVEDWLESHGIANAWDLAGPLVSLRLTHDDLESTARRFAQGQLASALRVICDSHTAFSLLEQVSHGMHRVSEIVAALKAYSYMDRAPVDQIDVHQGLDNTLIMLQGKLKSGVAVRRRYSADMPMIQSHGSELNQVWTNLIDNAIDAMDGRGEITIRTVTLEETVVVEVEDNGPGIDPDNIEHVFEPFFTTKLPGQGTGLGLNITYNIVTGQGGSIAVASEPGRTVFRVELPIARPDEVVA